MRSIELFAGAGGLALGLSRAGFAHEAIVEWDKYACATLLENQARGIRHVVDWPIWPGDVRSYPFGSVSGELDLLSGGVPCQPFSLAGKHRGSSDTRNMFPVFIEATRLLRPRAFLIENVKGLLRESFSEYLHYVKFWLEHPELEPIEGESWREHAKRLAAEAPYYDGLSYTVSIDLLDAADFGVPQRRERVFIVGLRSDVEATWAFPPSTHSRTALQYAQSVTGDYWGLRSLPRLQEANGTLSFRLGESLPWNTVRDAIDGLPEFNKLEAGQLQHRLIEGARPYPGHTGSPLDWPAKTLKAGDHGVPGGENMLRLADGTVRYFSIREAARLQTFPDDYCFAGSWTEAMRQIGNAVPVELAFVLGTQLRTRLAGAEPTLASESDYAGNYALSH